MSLVIENQAKLHRWVVWWLGRKLAKQLGIKDYVLSGSYRRGKTWCNDIDFLMKVHSESEKLGILTLVEKNGWKPRSDRKIHDNLFSHQFTKDSPNGKIVLDMFLASPGCWGNALLFTTGPRSFNDKIRSNVVGTGYTWTNPQYFTHIKTNNPLSFNEELSALKFLGADWIPPRKRK
jgi:DNA polymerase/3'-5' exonuclease PolX